MVRDETTAGCCVSGIVSATHVAPERTNSHRAKAPRALAERHPIGTTAHAASSVHLQTIGRPPLWLNAPVEPSDTEVSPDRFRLTVDGDAFDVAYDPTQPGAYHYTRLTGPAPGYGFTSRRSDYGRSTTAEHVQAIRSFLNMVDPATGYLEDDPDDDGEDDTLDE